MYDLDGDDPRNCGEALRRELDHEFDLARLRDGADEDTVPIWDGGQYVGGVPIADAPPAHTGTLLNLPAVQPVSDDRIKMRRRAIKRLMRQAPELFPRECKLFSEAWLLASPPSIRRYLDGDGSVDRDDVILNLLWRYMNVGRRPEADAA